MPHQECSAARENALAHMTLVLPLEALDRSSLPLAGGKAANLGELIRAGFVVPAGFCVTTTAYERVSAQAGLGASLSALENTENDDQTRQSELGAALRTALLQAPLPPEIIAAVTTAYQTLSGGEALPVSVRSSATAEDLPDASFAGQQETSLNVIGIEEVLTAIQRCFASLWTERAIQYRSNLGIPPGSVRLAVVVQRMVQAEVAGVLFTANPLTGKRHQAVIDANPGLGEAVVSGMTNPDHFVVQSISGEIIERRLGDKQVVIQAAPGGGTTKREASPSSSHACLSGAQIRALAALGEHVEAWYKAPQDIEWALDASGQAFLLQARPITTLFPLPALATQSEEELRVYLAFGVQQGTYRPFTPMGLSALQLLTSSFLTLIGQPPIDPLTGPDFVTEAAGRPFFDVTGALRSALGRSMLLEAMRDAEIHAAMSFEHLLTDPRLSLRNTSRRTLGRALFLLLARTRLPWYLGQAFFTPRVASKRVQRVVEQIRATPGIDPSADATAHLAAATSLLQRCVRVAFRVSPVMVAGMQSFALAKRLLGSLASESECQVVLGGSPTNPTTQMNLALWRLAQTIQADPASVHLLRSLSATQLTEEYQRQHLPAPLQQGLARFLQEYGQQSVCELDLGVTRWAEDPTYVLALLTDYVVMEQVRERVSAPDAQLAQAEHAAEAMIATLTQRARQKHWLKGQVVSLLLRRAHALAGFREMTRFVVGLVLGQARARLWSVGEALVHAGRLTQAEDIFFLSLLEVQRALAGVDPREQITERRVSFTNELKRRHVPLVLLSDGTEPTAQPEIVQRLVQEAAGTLQGVAASPGTVTAVARVVLDPSHAHLEPGEILVAPSTDPGWTPLFLKAAGLVMEVGGAMAHGAIVAREYGLPAVVGVTGATTRITTGSRLTINGTTGAIILEPEDEA
jgi:rifampicin phosphotransferase